MRYKVRIIIAVLTLISILSAYTAFLCYVQISDYEAQVRSLTKRIDETQSRWMGLNDEDLILLRRFDELNKRFNEVDQKIKINDIRITEIGAKLTRKK